jgi:5-formyltetrahydrofolate cyclo-ligase
MASPKLVDLADQKRLLRQAMYDRRLRLSPNERASAASAAGARLAALPELRAAVAAGATIAGFVAVRAEIDPAAALDEARTGGAKVALPRVQPDDEESRLPRGGDRAPRMHFHLAGASDLRPGRFGIPEPDASCPMVRPEDVAVMIVPGLAFDEAGQRLGSGGGYYDEILLAPGSIRPRLVVGLGYDFQVVDACPAGAKDARVDCDVTDGRVIRFAETGQSGGGSGA